MIGRREVLVLKGGRIIDPSRGIDGTGDLWIADGVIVKPGSVEAADRREIDCRGRIVAPGFIDAHVHLREPGREDEETIASGTAAAAAGGFTAVVCMPNTDPPADNEGTVAYILEQAARCGIVRVYPTGSITRALAGEHMSEIGTLKRAGAVAITDDGRGVQNAELMRRVLEYAKMFDLPVLEHCQDDSLTADGVMHEGYASTVLGLRGMPAAGEDVMVARDLLLAECADARIHIQHASTAGAVRLVRNAKNRGIAASAEATPHHLVLTDEAVFGYDTRFKVNPPLRSERHVEALREGIADGTIDMIATDHAPHTDFEKDVEFDYAPFGLIGLETAVAVCVDRLVHGGVISMPRLVELMSTGPARVLGLPGGTLAPDRPADVTVIDPELRRTVDPESFISRSRNTPFAGWDLKGWPVMTIVDGRIVHDETAPGGRR